MLKMNQLTEEITNLKSKTQTNFEGATEDEILQMQDSLLRNLELTKDRLTKPFFEFCSEN